MARMIDLGHLCAQSLHMQAKLDQANLLSVVRWMTTGNEGSPQYLFFTSKRERNNFVSLKHEYQSDGEPASTNFTGGQF